MVRITSYVLLAVAVWKRKLYLKEVERQERDKSDLKSFEFKELTFSKFKVLMEMEHKNQVNQRKLTDYFTVNRVTQMETNLKGTIVRFCWIGFPTNSIFCNLLGASRKIWVRNFWQGEGKSQKWPRTHTWEMSHLLVNEHRSHSRYWMHRIYCVDIVCIVYFV